MKKQADEAQKLFEEKENYRQLCEALYTEGVIKTNEQGVIVPVDDPLERESIKSKSKMKHCQTVDHPVESQKHDPFKSSQILDDENDDMGELA